METLSRYRRPVTHPRLQIVSQTVIEGLEPIDLAFDAIELGEALTQIERLGFPFLDVGLEVFHLLADGFAAGFQFLHRVLTKNLDEFFFLIDFVVEFDDLGMLGRRSLESVSRSALRSCSCCFAFK